MKIIRKIKDKIYVCNDIKNLDIANMKPVEALYKLNKYKRIIGGN